MLDDLQQFRQFDVHGIGLWRWKIEDVGKKRAIQLLEQSGLKATSLSMAGGFTGANGMTFVEALNDANRMIKLAHRTKCPVLVVTSGARGVHTRSHVLQIVAQGLAKLADKAADRGVTLALMPTRPRSCPQLGMGLSLDETLKIIETVNHPAVRLVFNTYHLGSTPNVLQRIPEIAPLTALVQVSDYSPEQTGAFSQCEPGDGQLPLAKMISAFDTAGYAGAYELNVWSERSWKSDSSTVLARSVQYLHKLMMPTVTV